MKADRYAGFTVIDLLVTVSILGIIIAIAIPNLISAVRSANDTAVRGYIHHVVKGVEAARNSDTNALPPTQSCASLTQVQVDPKSVTSCSYSPDLSSDRYTVTAISVTGNTFRYEGVNIVLVP